MFKHKTVKNKTQSKIIFSWDAVMRWGVTVTRGCQFISLFTHVQSIMLRSYVQFKLSFSVFLLLVGPFVCPFLCDDVPISSCLF